jgi:hypothetical protein
MNDYQFHGIVWFWNQNTKKKEQVETTLIIKAPTEAIARAIIANYGMDGMEFVPEKPCGALPPSDAPHQIGDSANKHKS